MLLASTTTNFKSAFSAFLRDNLDDNELKQEIFKLPQKLEVFNLAIQKAHQKQDLELLNKTFHQLAGYSAQMGLTQLSKHASYLELQLANNTDICLNKLTILCQDSAAEILKLTN